MTEHEKPTTKWQIPFFSIWTGQAFSLIGTRVAQFALVWWLTKLTGSATVLATASLAALIPDILLGPLAGAYVDRWNRRIVMIVADSLIALASLWLAFLFWTGAIEIWHVYVIMVVRSVGGAFHWPAMQSSTSLMVPKEHLSRVAGLNQAMKGALNIIGPPLGALLLELVPLHGVMMVDVGTAMLAVLPLFFVQVPQPRRKDLAAGKEGKPSIWSDMRGGLEYIRNWRGLMVLIGFVLVVKLALTPAFSLMPLLVSDHFQGDAGQLSLLESVAGVGIVAGGLILSVWGGFRRRIFTSMTGMIALGLGFMVLGLAPSTLFWIALGGVFIIGLMLPMVDGPLMAILQGTVAPEMQGRVFTIMSSLLSISSPIGLAIAGPVSDALGLQVWYVTAGVLCAVSGLAGFLVPAIVHIEENHGGQPAEGRQSALDATEVPAAGE
jgi:DHA3 family macrolide efflux protein-like MFS transporter